jgi:hypothetical protein
MTKPVKARPAPVIPPADILAALLARVEALRADIDRIIDERVAEMRVGRETVPAAVIRGDLTRHQDCRCAILRRFADAEKAQ